MFGVSFPELCVIFAVALLIFGPEKLPEIARTLGRLAAEFRKQSDAVRREFYNAVYVPAQDLTKDLKETERKLRAVGNEIKSDINPAAAGQTNLAATAANQSAPTGASCDCPEHQPEKKPE